MKCSTRDAASKLIGDFDKICQLIYSEKKCPPKPSVLIPK